MKKNKETIAANVVTYNRKKLLAECLDALLKQSYPLDAIYIIDNASTDGTPELLKEKGYIKDLPPLNLDKPVEKIYSLNMSSKGNEDKVVEVHYIRMNENTGSSGGQYEGVKRGYEKGYDWLWLMDDDAIPNKDCLENMVISKLFKKKSTGMLVPVIYGIDGKIQKYHHKKLNRFLNEKSALGEKEINIKDFKNYYKKPIKLDANCFVGPLIRKEATNKIGFPEKDFFIWCDDLEYTYRIARYFNIYLIPLSQVMHKDFNPVILKAGKNRIPFKSYWKVYYGTRNTIYFKKIYLNSQVKFLFFCKLLLQFIKKIIGILVYDDLKFKRLKILFFAYYDGIRGNLGKRFS